MARNQGRSTIIDVAREAGVSIASVSHVLNGTKAVSPALRAKVEEAIAHLGYRPSHLASSLRRQRSATVGILLANMAGSHVNGMLKGVVDALAEHGFAALLADSEGSTQHQREQITRFLDREVDACIVEPVAGTGQGFTELLEHTRAILIGDRIPGADCPAVVPDLAAGVRAAAAWALRQGRRVAFMAEHLPTPQRQEAFRGFGEAFGPGVQVPTDLVCTAPPTPEGGYKQIQRLVDLDPPISGVVVAHPLMTLGAVEMWHALGGRRLFALAGMGAEGYGMASADAGMIAVPAREIGRRAVEVLAGARAGEIPPDVVRLPVRFVPPVGGQGGEANAGDLSAV